MGIVNEAKFETCDKCGNRKRVADEVRGCDVCGRPEADGDQFGLLAIEIFRKGDDSPPRVDCCSWACVFKALPTVETDYFVSLPMLHFDDAPEGRRAADFFAAFGVK